MPYIVRTTHVTPAPSTLYLIAHRGTLHTCPWCGEVLGYGQGAEERCALESMHRCELKQFAVAPAATVPFN